MISETVLVTGATGTVGSRVLVRLVGRDVTVRAALRNPEDERDALPDGVEAVSFDFEKPETWGVAFEGVDRVLLIRPPAISRVGKSFNPAIEAAERVGVEHVVVLSVLGAENNPLLPHRRIEKHVLGTDLDWTFLRPSFFMQNLSQVHRTEIVEQGEIVVPAGDGTTSFVDAADIAAVAVETLTGDGHAGQAYDVTGPEALSYHEAAATLTDVLDREVTYEEPSLVRFARHSRRLGRDWPFVIVMAGLYTTARLGLAGRVSDDVERLLDRPPTSFREWAETNAHLFEPHEIDM
ncbi:MAG: SDR family oxidoreductase [Halapricum sp.]